MFTKIIIVKINDSKIGDNEINILKVYTSSLQKSYAYHTSETKLTICVHPYAEPYQSEIEKTQ